MEGGRRVEGRVPARLTSAEGRHFGGVVGAAFLVLAGVAYWRGHMTVAGALALVGSSLLLAGLLIPTRLGPVQRGWMRFALLLSRVTTPLLMGLIYYLVITPTGLIMRALGRNPLIHAESGRSYWAARPAGRQRRSNLQRQF
jgi:hypothetical protein